MWLKVKSLSRVRLFAIPWTVAYEAPQFMEFSRQEYWSGLLFPSPGDLPAPGIEPGSPALQADALTSEPPEKPECGWVSFNPKTSLVAQVIKHLPAMQKTRVQSLGQEDPLEKGMATHSNILA